MTIRNKKLAKLALLCSIATLPLSLTTQATERERHQLIHDKAVINVDGRMD